MTKNQKKTLMIYLGPAVLIIVIFLYFQLSLILLTASTRGEQSTRRKCLWDWKTIRAYLKTKFSIQH